MKTTKELARELGLIRRRSVVTSVSSKRSHGVCQPFAYLIVLDFESTCWQDKKFRTQEIIEFPAVLLNTSTGQIESEFHFYVQPEEQPILSDFCRELTGITQDQVEDGIPLRLCLRKFSHWLDKLKNDKDITFPTQKQSNGGTGVATLVTWSDWDLGVCLFNEVRRKQLVKPSPLNSWIDLRATYRKFYNRRPNGLNGALQDLGINFEGREHSGLHDARNTANLAWRMICDGCVLTTTKTIGGINGGNNKAGLGLPHHVTTISPYSPSKSPCHKRRKITKDVKGQKVSHLYIKMPSPSKEGVSETKRTNKQMSPKRRSPRTALKPGRIPLATPSPPKRARQLLMSVPRSKNKPSKVSVADLIYRDPISEEEHENNATKYGSTVKSHISSLKQRDNNIVMQPKMTPNKPTARVCKKTVTLTSIQQVTINSSCVQSSTVLKTPGFSKSSSFKTPSPLGSSRIKPTVLPSGSKVTQSGSFNQSSFRTPNSSSEMKCTPPLCKCGKRAKRRIVQSPGPNFGRFFFSCACGSQHGSKGCGFFKWETTGTSGVNTSHHGMNVSRPFKQVCPSGMSQRRYLGVRPTVTRQPIR